MLITNAKLEYKRLSSWKNKQDAKDEDAYNYDNEAPIEELNNYLTILYPFKTTKK